MKVFTPQELSDAVARRSEEEAAGPGPVGNKYLAVLVAARYARELNAPFFAGAALGVGTGRPKKVTTRALEDMVSSERNLQCRVLRREGVAGI
ncbi:MAG: DNA-directed RNA polymerase subunit omega [Gemmatimonadetes bacterium]|nr:DNA-directed RNA polymerase subunit omega [Gemmatimonadota bacterium]